MNLSESLSDRLREERTRLKFNQKDFGELVGATKHTQLNWEKGQGAPDARALKIWAEHGLDVTYVVTGQRPIGKAKTLYEVSLLMEAIDQATASNEDIGRAVHDRYNNLYDQAVAQGRHPGQPLSPLEQRVLDTLRASSEEGRKAITRLVELEAERALILRETKKPSKVSKVKIAGDGNTIGSGNSTVINNKKSTTKAKQ